VPVGVIVFARAIYTLQLFRVVSHGPVIQYLPSSTPACYYASVSMHSLFWVVSPLIVGLIE
jgi:hypothetical protein